ncbi:uncharacterized protein LOC124286819 [Haliotis rubra]|uniref:uncharacterized protein LOC124286819 n=1 Tax=Haliotis rubra TaxID=36100 RepID=UPI001EE5FDDD|nr:uncharacterized protein LOC124286819 [Haliotis rubra]
MSRRTKQPTEGRNDLLGQDICRQKWPRDRLPPRRRQYDQFQEFKSDSKGNQVRVLERLPIEYYQLSKTSRDKILTHRQETMRRRKPGGHSRDGDCNRMDWFSDVIADLTEDRPVPQYLTRYQDRLKRHLEEQRQTIEELERKKEEELRKVQLVQKKHSVARQQRAVCPAVSHHRKEIVFKSKRAPVVIPSAEPPTRARQVYKAKKPAPITLPVISTGSGISNGEHVWAMGASEVEIHLSGQRLGSKTVLPPIHKKNSRQRKL